MNAAHHVLVAGSGGVLGHAICEEFAAAGSEVSALRRTAHDADSIAGVHTMACDLLDARSLRTAIEGAIAARGPVDVLVCHAAHLVVAPIAEVSPSDFETSLRVGVGMAFHAVQAVLAPMRVRGSGTILFTGATASLRGSARFAALAAAKFALRGFAQALARELQPQGIHVAHVVVDGLLLGSPSVQRFGGSEARTIDPREAARAYRWLSAQNRSCWTHELDLRPHDERF